MSQLQKARQSSRPQLPGVFSKTYNIKNCESITAGADSGKSKISLEIEVLKKLFPNTYGLPRVEVNEAKDQLNSKKINVGLVLSGGQAPGGHNVIAGIYDYVKQCGGKVYGFKNGPIGVYTADYVEISDEFMNKYRNMGGFDMIGSGRHKIETPEQFKGSEDAVKKLDLDGLIVIGGDDSNTNAALLAESFAQKKLKCKVIGCPKTIDGDLKNEYVPISFGFDTACKTFSEEIGNICCDAISSQKYYHFIRLMGRSASHVTLECALETHPNAVLIGEQVATEKWDMKRVAKHISDIIVKRSQNNKEYGVVLLPEGLIEFIPEMCDLISKLNDIIASAGTNDIEIVKSKLPKESLTLFEYLPALIQQQLLLDRDAHGNVQVSMIDTELLVIGAVQTELEILQKEGKYNGKLTPMVHFLGYEGRCSYPSLFDSTYCYVLGYNAGVLINSGITGYMSYAKNLDLPPEKWEVGGVPITMMMNIERRAGKDKPVIKKALVELDGAPFKFLQSNRDKWALGDYYRNPGPIQFEGESAGEINITLKLEIQASKK